MPDQPAVEVSGDQGSLLVLRAVMFGNRRTLPVLQSQSEEGIASTILSDRERLARADVEAVATLGG